MASVIIAHATGINYAPGRGKIVLRNVNNVNNLTARRKGLQRFWLHPRDRYHAVTQMYNIRGGVMSLLSPRCPPLLDRLSARSGSVAIRKTTYSYTSSLAL